jgi:hypothetical protein
MVGWGGDHGQDGISRRICTGHEGRRWVLRLMNAMGVEAAEVVQKGVRIADKPRPVARIVELPGLGVSTETSFREEDVYPVDVVREVFEKCGVVIDVGE